VFSFLALEPREESEGLNPMQVSLQLPLQTGCHPMEAGDAMSVCPESFG
jgi:hypothetical protein